MRELVTEDKSGVITDSVIATKNGIIHRRIDAAIQPR